MIVVYSTPEDLKSLTSYVMGKMQGPQPPPLFTGNGVGTASTHWLCRELLWFIDDETYELIARCAARFHDWGYTVGGSKRVRRQIDRFLRRNVRFIVRFMWRRYGLIMGKLRQWYATWKVYRGVRLFGWAAWHYC